jgi:hypothetical protein
MYQHPYLLQKIAEEHSRDMRTTAAAVSLARQARRDRRGRPAARHAAATAVSSGRLLRAIPRPRAPQEETAHRAA